MDVVVNRVVDLSFFGFSFGLKEDRIMNKIKIPPRNSMKKIIGIQTLLFSRDIEKNVRHLRSISLALIFTGLDIFNNVLVINNKIIFLNVNIFLAYFKASVLGIEELRKYWLVEFFLFSCLFFLLVCFFNYFRKKLLALLILEALIIFIIFFFFKSYSSSCLRFIIPFSMSILMVLDSVFGVCLLISVGRRSNLSFSSINFF